MLYMLKLSGAARLTRLLSLAALEHMVVIIMFYCQPIATPSDITKITGFVICHGVRNYIT